MITTRILMASCLTCVLVTTSKAILYRVYDVGNDIRFPGAYSRAYAVNNSGTVVGEINQHFGFSWTVSAGLKLSSPGATIGNSDVMAISNSGLMTGQFVFPYSHPLLYQGFVRRTNGTLIRIPSFALGKMIHPSAINDNMEVVGEYQDNGHPIRAFYWSPATGLTDIGTVADGYNTTAVSINSSGLVPFSFSNRVLKEYGVCASTPESVERLPLPARPVPRQIARALRIMLRLPELVQLPASVSMAASRGLFQSCNVDRHLSQAFPRCRKDCVSHRGYDC